MPINATHKLAIAAVIALITAVSSSADQRTMSNVSLLANQPTKLLPLSSVGILTTDLKPHLNHSEVLLVDLKPHLLGSGPYG
jgi:uncharacterized protein YjfI (DUF2170 family)